VIWELRKGTALLRCRQEARLLRGLRTFSWSLGVFAFLLFPLLVRPPSHTPHTLSLSRKLKQKNVRRSRGESAQEKKLCLFGFCGWSPFLSFTLSPPFSPCSQANRYDSFFSPQAFFLSLFCFLRSSDPIFLSSCDIGPFLLSEENVGVEVLFLGINASFLEK